MDPELDRRRLTVMLKLIHEVRSLVDEAQDAESVIRRVCDHIVQVPRVTAAWAILFDDSRTPREIDAAYAAGTTPGIVAGFDDFVERFRDRRCCGCIAQVVEAPGPVELRRDEECDDSRFLAELRTGSIGLAIRLGRGEQVFGILSIWRPGDVPITDDARLFMGELAAEITGRLFHLSLLRDKRILRDSLFRRENEYERIVREAPVGILRVSLSGEVLDLNVRCATILGYRGVRNAMAALTSVPGAVLENPEEWPAFVERLNRDGEIREFEISARRTGGEALRLSITARLQYEAEDIPPVILCFLQDVTDLSRALTRAELLLREVHHRVKNNLTVILSLLNLAQLRLEEPGSAHIFERSASRIRAIALVHELVYRSTMVEEIALHELVNEIFTLVRYGASEGRRVAISTRIDTICAPIDAAVPFALIVLELVTNAFAHGGDNDTVKIDAGLQRNTDGDVFFFVDDAGPGYADWERGPLEAEAPAPGLGLQLVNMLVGQLDGEWSISPRDDGPGTSCRVHLPRTTMGFDASLSECRESSAPV